MSIGVPASIGHPHRSQYTTSPYVTYSIMLNPSFRFVIIILRSSGKYFFNRSSLSINLSDFYFRITRTPKVASILEKITHFKYYSFYDILYIGCFYIQKKGVWMGLYSVSNTFFLYSYKRKAFPVT